MLLAQGSLPEYENVNVHSSSSRISIPDQLSLCTVMLLVLGNPRSLGISPNPGGVCGNAVRPWFEVFQEVLLQFSQRKPKFQQPNPQKYEGQVATKKRLGSILCELLCTLEQ